MDEDRLNAAATVALDSALHSQAGVEVLPWPTDPTNVQQRVNAAKDNAPMAWDLTRFVLWMKADPVRWEKFIFIQDSKIADAALEYTGE